MIDDVTTTVIAPQNDGSFPPHISGTADADTALGILHGQRPPVLSWGWSNTKNASRLLKMGGGGVSSARNIQNASTVERELSQQSTCILLLKSYERVIRRSCLSARSSVRILHLRNYRLGYWLDGPGSIPGKGRKFFLCHRLQTDSGAHPEPSQSLIQCVPGALSPG
jgi:hypothetical protein